MSAAVVGVRDGWPWENRGLAGCLLPLFVYGTAGSEKTEVWLRCLLPLLVCGTAGPEKTEVCLGSLLLLLVYGTTGPEKDEVWLGELLPLLVYGTPGPEKALRKLRSAWRSAAVVGVRDGWP